MGDMLADQNDTFADWDDTPADSGNTIADWIDRFEDRGDSFAEKHVNCNISKLQSDQI